MGEAAHEDELAHGEGEEGDGQAAYGAGCAGKAGGEDAEEGCQGGFVRDSRVFGGEWRRGELGRGGRIGFGVCGRCGLLAGMGGGAVDGMHLRCLVSRLAADGFALSFGMEPVAEDVEEEGEDTSWGSDHPDFDSMAGYKACANEDRYSNEHEDTEEDGASSVAKLRPRIFGEWCESLWYFLPEHAEEDGIVERCWDNGR